MIINMGFFRLERPTIERFPEEVADDIRRGETEPVLFSGPFLTLSRKEEAVVMEGFHERMRQRREAREAHGRPFTDSELLAQARAELRCLPIEQSPETG
jgi:hypothetical protein